jgi:LPXTG-motif cell wall-anchored protein
MTHSWRKIAMVVALSLPLAGIAAISPAAAAPDPAPNPAPVVVPSLHEWTGGSGQLEITPASRIVVPAALDKAGKEFAADLAEMTGLELTVVTGAAQAGDISLVLDAANKYAAGGVRYDKEGYKLDVTATGAAVTAPTETGVYYGTRSILQIMTQSNGRNKMPVGAAVDWPDYEARGFILDVGRRFFTADFINDYIKMMSYYKLNRFQIHLNDNEIFPANNDWTKSYKAFRLKSDNPTFAGLAATDGSYDRKDWDGFEATAAGRGVQIVPEIDAPAHSAAIIAWRPSIGRDSGMSDHLDLSKPETTAAMKEIFAEFTPWFKGPEVSFGADEYPSSLTTDFRTYYNTMAGYLRTLGKQPNAWGSFSYMGGGVAGYDKNVTINSWNNDWYGLSSAAADGMKFINTNDASLYVVPFADYYHGAGLNNQYLYTDWLPNTAGNQTVAPEKIMGAMFAVWNDLVDKDYSQQDVHGLIERSFPAVAQKTWTAKAPTVPYATFNSTLDKVGMGPGLSTVKSTTAAAGASDLASGKPVTASSATPGHPASNLTDGVLNTRWESAGADPASVTIDLGTVQKVGGINAEWAANAPASFAVETSKDGLFWDRVSAHTVTGAGTDSVQFPTKEARFVRLAGLAPAGNTRAAGSVGAWSIGVQGATNVALGASATSSGVEAAGFPANLAFDGDAATRWSASYQNPRWIAGDMGNAQTVNEVTIAWEGASATDYTISTSPDGATWTVAATKTGMPATKRTDVVAIAPVLARYVKVDSTGLSVSPYLSIYEVEVRNTALTSLGVSGALDIAPNADGKFDAEPTLTLSATGDAAAGSGIEYKVGPGAWTPYSAPVKLAGYRPTTVEYRATAGEESFAGYAVLDLDTPGASPSPTASPSASASTSATPTTEPTEAPTTAPTSTPTASPSATGTTDPSTTPSATASASTTASGSARTTAGAGISTASSSAASVAPTDTDSEDTLASTGANVMALALGGLLLMGVGALALVRRRPSRGRYQG